MKHHSSYILLLFFLVAGIVSVFPVLGAEEARRDETHFSLIESAYSKGEIDYETALLNKVYAIFHPERLQTRFQVKGLRPQKSATPLFVEIRERWSTLSPSARAALGPYLLRPTEPNEQEPLGHAYAADPDSFDTPSGHFRIWFVRTTEDAPDSTDVDPEDGVPDYVNRCGEIFDHVWEREVDEMGYKEPPPDGDWYQAGQDYGGDPRYDVYLEDLGERIFGYTQPEYVASGRSATSYIVMDDDYEWYPTYTRGKKEPIDALRVTAAHEFFHAIHFGYDAVETASDRYWMEISAVWMEDKMYDDVNDYLYYLPRFFDNPGVPLDRMDGQHEYSSCIWAMFLDQKYGADIIHDIWEGCVTMSALDAIQVALNSRGSSLAEAFETFSVWNYFTENRANPTLYYEEGADFPSMRFTERHISYPASGAGSLDHLAARYVGFIPERTSGGLQFSFNGTSRGTWGAMVIEYESTSRHFVTELQLDAEQNGTHSTPNWSHFVEIVLVPSVVSVMGQAYTYTYDGDHVPGLTTTIEVNESTHDFGNVTIGAVAEWLLLIYNRGNDLLTIHSISVDADSGAVGAFGLHTTSFPKTVQERDSLEAVVTFQPPHFGSFTGDLVISSDDTVLQTVRVKLSGFGSPIGALRQNAPNPYKVGEHEKTDFHFDLPERAIATISIHTLAGELVRVLRLSEEPLEVDTHKISWDGRNERGEYVASGIYLYTLKAGNVLETRKMAVIR